MAGMRYQPQGRFRVRQSGLGGKLVASVVASQQQSGVLNRPVTLGAGVSRVATPQGVAFQHAVNNGAVDFGAPGGLDSLIPTGTGFTVFWRGYVSTLGVRQGIMTDHNAAGAGDSYTFEITAANEWKIQTLGGANPVTISGVTTGLHDVCIVYRPGVGHYISVDGGPYSGMTFGGNLTAGTALRLGGFGAYPSLGFMGRTAVFHLFKGDVTDQLQALRSNPWQVFDDPVDEDELLLAAGGAGATATPQGVSAAASVGTASASAGAQAAPVGVTASSGVGTGTATGEARAAPTGVGAAGQVGTPVATGGAAAAPAGVSASASVGAATATGGSASTAFPAGVTAAASVGSPTASAGATAVPVGVGALAQVGTATATGGSASTAAPAGVSATASVGLASATGGASAAPLGVTASASVGTASASAGSSISGTATPAGVGASASVGTAAGSGGAGCAPAGVAAFASVGAVIAAGNISIPGPGRVDVSTISPARIVVFEGSGSRVVPFEGSGSRVVRFE